jgi:hypothetical protein
VRPCLPPKISTVSKNNTIYSGHYKRGYLKGGVTIPWHLWELAR